jgi:hypothetical protein
VIIAPAKQDPATTKPTLRLRTKTNAASAISSNPVRTMKVLPMLVPRTIASIIGRSNDIIVWPIIAAIDANISAVDTIGAATAAKMKPPCGCLSLSQLKFRSPINQNADQPNRPSSNA